MSRAGQIEKTAAQWLVRREDPEWSASDQIDLEAWLTQSLAHQAAYWRLEHGWREADRIGALGRDALLDHRLPLFAQPRRLTAIAALIAAFAVMVTLVAMHSNPRQEPKVAALHFTTPVGGRQIVPLVDGSKVELNTASAMRTAVTDKKREVWLDRGEAYFEIAHMAGRPFVVHAGSRTVTVLGTKFSVRRDGDKVTVSVVEGRVRIDDAMQPDAVPAAIITAGDVAVAQGPSTLLAAKSADRVESALAWRAGILNFSDTPLVEAVAEFNRYNQAQIEIGDVKTGQIRIGGVFQASNVDAFVRLLRDAYGLHVETGNATIKISE